MSKNFYRAFEDKHRGSRQLIRQRLEAYIPFVRPLLDVYPDAQAIDLGCGRGEWLELLGELGFKARGVDMDEGMLEACNALDLKTDLMDALAALRQLPDASQAVISGFHLVEHIPFDVLLALVTEAKRVLLPAGLLIFETPNPENLIVGTSSFYLDPTHIKPIPPLMLTFLPEFVGGYSKIKTIGLQEPIPQSKYALGMMDIFTNVSPDYALIAQKEASSEIAEATSAAFFVERGVTLPAVSASYDDQLRLKFSHLEALSRQALLSADEAKQALIAIYSSKSWQLTAPLRWANHQLHLLREHGVTTRLKSFVKKALRPFVRLLVKFLRLNPRAFRCAQSILRAMHAHAILERLRLRVSGTDEAALGADNQSFLQTSPCSARAQKALDTLKAEIQKKHS
jgi:O-antigen chain-terminating methyltransferase